MSPRLLATTVLALAGILASGCCKLSEKADKPQATLKPIPDERTAPTPEAAPQQAEALQAEGAPPAGADPKLARNFYVVFDGSGSMRERRCAGNFDRKIEAAQWAFGEFLGSVGESDNLGLLVFDKDGLRERVPLGAGTRDRVLAAVNAVRAGEGTPLGPAIRLAVKALMQQHEEQLGYGEYHLVVVTDGRADDARVLQQAVRQSGGSGVLLHTIGFCVEEDNALKTASYSYRTANDPEELRSAVVSVLAEAEDFQALQFERVR